MRVINFPPNSVIVINEIMIPLSSVYFKEREEIWLDVYNLYTDNWIGRTKENFVGLVKSIGTEG